LRLRLRLRCTSIWVLLAAEWLPLAAFRNAWALSVARQQPLADIDNHRVLAFFSSPFVFNLPLVRR